MLTDFSEGERGGRGGGGGERFGLGQDWARECGKSREKGKRKTQVVVGMQKAAAGWLRRWDGSATFEERVASTIVNSEKKMFCILDLSVSVSPVRRLNMRSALIMPVLYMAHSNKGGGTGTSVEIPSHVDGSYSDNALISSLVKELPSRICRKCSVNNFECFPRRKAKLERKHIYPSISKFIMNIGAPWFCLIKDVAIDAFASAGGM